MAGVVSREAELVAIAEFLSSAAEGPRALMVEGEAGIGKTTLWRTAVEHARERGVRVLSARPNAAESLMAYASLADLLAGVEATAWASLPDPQRIALDGALLRTTADEVLPGRRAVAAGFLAVVEDLTAASPVLIAIDDLQWLDSSTAEAIAFATRRLSGPVGVLATVRTGDSAIPARTLQLPNPDAAQRITVPPLSLGALRTLISDRLGRPLPRRTMVRIQETSAGNPFYALELARAIDDTSPERPALPTTLAALVNARIAGLAPDVQEMLLAAACLAAPTVELAAGAVDADRPRLDAMLGAAEANGIIAIDGHWLRFTHPLLAYGVYAEASPARRRAMHARLADLVGQPEPRARHLALAATHGDARTLESLDGAAEIARLRGAPAAAGELLDLAIKLGGDTPQRRIQLAACWFNSGDGARARIELEAVTDSAAPRELRAEASNLLAVISQLEGSLPDAAEELASALDDAGENLALRAQILTSLSWVQIHTGQLAPAECSIDDAVADAEQLRQSDLLSQALGMHVVVHLLLGHGLDDQTLCRALELEPPNPTVTVMFRAAVHRAMVLSWTGQLDAARAAFAAIRQSCIERGEESELVFVSVNSVFNEIWRADFTSAALIAEDTAERALDLEGPLPLAAALTARAMVAAYAGREDDARRDVGKAIGPISDYGSQILFAWTMRVVGFLEVSLGNYPAAITALEPLLERIYSAPHATEIFVARFLPDAVEAMIHVGRLDDAEPLTDMLESNGRRLDRPWMLALGARCRAMLLAARADLDEATDAAQQAMAEHDRLPMPFERARTRLLLGQLQRRQRHKQAAAESLAEALREFENLGTPLWADRVRDELGRAYAGTHRSTGLTPSERRVAELAASGMTNRDVAAALFISPRTVETNLARIYRKLGIRSRAELGQRMSRADD